MNPLIFKILLTVFLAIGIIANLHGASKGEHTKVQKPGILATAAVVGTLILIGIWWLF